MSNPLDDESRWVFLSSRFETPTFIVDEMRKMFRDCYGAAVADAMEAAIPPPYGTFGAAESREEER